MIKRELASIKKIDEDIKKRIDKIKDEPSDRLVEINTVKAIKTTLYENILNIFTYNLKKLIQIEGTQKRLAKKIGVSEDLLSKYKSGEAFPSIETLSYMSKIYDITIDKLINSTFTAFDIESFVTSYEDSLNFFYDKYYCYFFTTNIGKEGAVHEGLLEINDDKANFKIISNTSITKSFSGKINISDKIISFILKSMEDGNAYINMIKPNINKGRYIGGLAMLFLPSDANSKPCTQKILISKLKINRENYSENLKVLLNFNTASQSFGNVKISPFEDEQAYNFIDTLS